MGPRSSRLVMVRKNWDQLPDHSLPAGHGLRWYQPGDEMHWSRIHLATEHEREMTSTVFPEQFGSDQRSLSERQCYLLNPRGEVVGTATAWFDPTYDEGRWGRVHWVAVLPAVQGLGLGAALMSAVCRRLLTLGHERAFLRTAPSRLPAINLYLRFGFEPQPRDNTEREVWQSLAPKLKYPLRLD